MGYYMSCKSGRKPKYCILVYDYYGSSKKSKINILSK